MGADDRTPVATDRLRAISKHLQHEVEMWCASRDMLAARLWDDIEGEHLKGTARNALRAAGSHSGDGMGWAWSARAAARRFAAASSPVLRDQSWPSSVSR